MEIGPISGIRSFATVKARPADPELSAVFDIDAMTGGGDNLRRDARLNAAGGEDEDAEDAVNPEDEVESDADSSTLSPSGSVSFFA